MINQPFILIVVLSVFLRITKPQCNQYDSATCNSICYQNFCNFTIPDNGAFSYCCNGCDYWQNSNYRYRHPNDDSCVSSCPDKYYPAYSSGTGVCYGCHSYCATCTSSGNTGNCQSCESYAYRISGVDSCYNYAYSDSVNFYSSYTSNPCPTPYYGIPSTKVCQPCPTGCSSCALNLEYEMPYNYVSTNTTTIGCFDTGGLCLYALRCFTTYGGYSLRNGVSVLSTSCNSYCYKPSGSNTCLDGYYYINNPYRCGKCSIYCLTCYGSSSGNCNSCPTGYDLSGSTCYLNTTYQQMQNWNSWGSSDTLGGSYGTFTRSHSNSTLDQRSCPPTSYVFGYWGYNPSTGASLFPAAYLTYDGSGFGVSHYGVRIRAQIIFVDKWSPFVSLSVREGSGYPLKFGMNYDFTGIVGQDICGRSYTQNYDFLATMDGWFSHRTDALNLKIIASKVGYAWGISKMIIQTLICHSSCATCYGLSSTNCLTCSVANKTPYNGQCKCNLTGGYFVDSNGACVNNCTTSPYLYTDNVTGNCIKICKFPTQYPYFDSGSGLNKCYSNCPNSLYKFNQSKSSCAKYWQLQDDGSGNWYWNYYDTCPAPSCSSCIDTTCLKNSGSAAGASACLDSTCFDQCYLLNVQIICSYVHWQKYCTLYFYQLSCVSGCYNNSLAVTSNYYNYDGQDKICYSTCPSNTIADPVNKSCVTKCPSTYYAQGNYCTQTCTSPIYKYEETRKCVSSCPTGYYTNTLGSHNLCQLVCTVTLGGEKNFADNSTGSCVDLCPTDSFADSNRRVCVNICQAYGGITYYRHTYANNTRVCIALCPSGTYGNPLTGYCVSAANCPTNYFGDPNTTFCSTTCSDPLYFGKNSSKTCESSCDSNWFKQNATKLCVARCPFNNTNGTSQFGDIHYTNYCVENCSNDTYEDTQNTSLCVRTCSATPSQSYGLNNICVFNCSNTTWADPFHANRICTTSCTLIANGTQTYGYNATRKCVTQCPDTEFSIFISSIPVCVATCLSSQSRFGYPLNNTCVLQCPDPYYADPSPGGNRQCVKQCPDGYYSVNITSSFVITTARVCATSCTTGWQDNSTRSCAITSFGCSSGTYADDSTHMCMIPMDCSGSTFADPITNKCETTCHSNGSVKYFGDRSTKTCVLICPTIPDTYGDNQTNQCESTCTSNSSLKQYRDVQSNRRCMTACTRTPIVQFADRSLGTCVVALNCTNSTYGDNSTNQCEPECLGSTLLYADPVRLQCVALCQLNYYALNTTVNLLDGGICSRTCPYPQWADNLTVQCTLRCSANTYGVNYTNTSVSPNQYGVCESECPINQFARDSDNLCVSNCGPGLWGETVTRRCLTLQTSCPDGYYADNTTHMCVVPLNCSVVNNVSYVADNNTKQCLGGNLTYSGCPSNNNTFQNFADMDKKLCVKVCPYNKYGQNSTMTCVSACEVTGQFADKQLRLCVQICSAAPISTFGENTTYTCVEAKQCPNNTWAEIEVYNRQCRPICPPPNTSLSNLQKWADNTTKTCVTTCPTHYYGDLSTGEGRCVSICPNSTANKIQFADNLTKTCVQECPSSVKYFGDVISRRCVLVCPQGWFAQEPSRYCVQTCRLGTWAESITRYCVDMPINCTNTSGLHYYADNTTFKCVQTCPNISNATHYLWGENSTWECRTSCLTGFKYNKTRVCIDICPNELDNQGSFADQGMCYYQCVTPGYFRDPQNLRICTNSCSFTPLKYYQDLTTYRCVLTCPSYPEYYYSYDANKSCLTTCPLATMKDPKSKRCVDACPLNTFFDPNSDQCVEICPYDFNTSVSYYGDSTQTIPICVINTACPNNSYADDLVRLCVSACTEYQWKYQKNCVKICPDGYYGNSNTGFCVLPINCPFNGTNYYANNQTKTCVSVCNGSFADTNAKTCVNVCPTTYYADPYTRICSQSCTNTSSVSLIKNLLNQTCISNCPQEMFLNVSSNKCEATCDDPYYADSSTQICVSVCPSVPQLYGQNDTNKCVQECSNITNEFKLQTMRVCVVDCPLTFYRDNTSRYCVLECLEDTYADDTSKYCVSNCTPKFSLDEPINICSDSCPSPFYKDPLNYKCVLTCPTSPAMYFKVVTATDRRCDLNCPAGFRDRLSQACVATCPPSPPTYADTFTGNCVTICPTMYADKDTRVCRKPCGSGMFAEDTTRTCVSECPEGSDTYADSTLAVPFCVTLCSPGLYANPSTRKCVVQSACPDYPKMYGYQDTNSTIRMCVESCPYPFIANNITRKCQLKCINASIPYLDRAALLCVFNCTSPVYMFSYMPAGNTTEGECVKFCPNGTFALLTNNSCVTKCPNGLYGDTKNNTCYENCTQANNRYADNTTNRCVDVCPNNSTYDYFADRYSRKCMPNCPSDKFTFADTHTRHCEARCSLLTEYANPKSRRCETMCPDTPLPTLYADPTTQTCVQNCSLYIKRYIYTTNRTCMEKCPFSGLYADDLTRTCVSSFNCPTGFWGLDPQRICIDMCPIIPDLYGNPDTKTCTIASDCVNTTFDYFADPVTRECVTRCPQIPSLFADNSTRRCVAECPNNSYADNYTRRCVRYCSIIPIETYADNSTNRCVAQCPTQPNYFASNQTYECVKLCPLISQDLFADYSTRKCVKNCPGSNIDTYADSSIRFCVRTCPGYTYMENTTRRCVDQCLTGFADPKSKFCIDVCPHYTYGYTDLSNNNRSCVADCPILTPALYAEDNNNLCVTDCLLVHKTFADPYSHRCVKICPISQGYFSENQTRTCMPDCPDTPIKKFADYSTRECVIVCPSIPALYGINNTRICSLKCPNGTWAENTSRRCIDLCPVNPQYYGDNSTWSCVSICPTQPNTFSDNSTRICVPVCPSSPDYYSDNSTRRCVFNCSQGTYADNTTRKCVQTCPPGYYGYNGTYRCLPGCPVNEFADHLLRLCVAKCSVDPVFYGNPDTHNCTEVCPVSNYSYGNPLTQECVKYDLSTGYSGCPSNYYSQNISRLCVQVCPLKQDTYGDNSTRKCVSKCPAGAQNTFSDNSTMKCVKKCPTYPEYYAQEYSRRCVYWCLQANISFTGTFSQNITRKCVPECPSDPDYYSDNSTRRCVFYCPHQPLTFADNSTRRCVTTCPSTPNIYGDLSTLRCVQKCPQSQITFADNSTRMCVKVCPSSPQQLYAENQTNVCVKCNYINKIVCPNNSYADNASRICIEICPNVPDTYGDSSTNTCVLKCPDIPQTFADPLSRRCVDRCPDGYYAQNISNRCLPQCPMELVNYADNVTNRCVEICPASNKTYGDNSTRKCVYNCPKVPETYADNVTRMCLRICLNQTDGGYADNVTLVCVTNCPSLSYADITTRFCVFYCPQGWYADDDTNMCVLTCIAPYFSDNTTWKCVRRCPPQHSIFGESIGDRTCTDMCPNTTYADTYSQLCVPQCPSKDYYIPSCVTNCPTNVNDSFYNQCRQACRLTVDTFAYEDTRTCVKQCPFSLTKKLYGYPVTYVCLQTCLNPYYENITDHRCYKCPQQCVQCNYPQLCISCIPNHYLYLGACLQSCPTFPVVTFANPNGVCGTTFQCSAGFFALNTTKTCVQICPNGFFKNNDKQFCEPCLRGCILCTNALSCITCNTTISVWYENKCYTFCSPLRKFYSTLGCVSACPEGYYSILTTCYQCSDTCKRCIVNATNCLICASGLYIMNGSCVQKCPTDFKAVLNGQQLSCKSCSVVDCSVKPLTYTTKQYVENFKYKISMTFSEKVNITDTIDKVIQIKKKNSNARLLEQQSLSTGLIQGKRLLVVTYSYLSYTIIDYENGQYDFILNQFNASSESDLQFEVQIVSPQSIKSSSGQFPETTRTTVTASASSFYGQSNYNANITNYCIAVNFVFFILLVISFWTQHSIWTPILDYMQIIFSLFFINVVLPPNALYVLGMFKISSFVFLPNMFESSLPKGVASEANSGSILSILGDLSFLRSMGYLMTVLLITIVVMVCALMLSKRVFGFEWIRSSGLKSWSKKFIRETFWKKHLIGLMYLFTLPIFLFGLVGINEYIQSDYFYKNTPIIIFSIAISWIFMIAFIIILLILTHHVYKFITNYQKVYLSLKKAYSFITHQQMVLPNNSKFYYKMDGHEIDVTNLSSPKMDGTIIIPYPIYTYISPSFIGLPILHGFVKILLGIGLCGAFYYPLIQIAIWIGIHLTILIYYLASKPYLNIDYSSTYLAHKKQIKPDDKKEEQSWASCTSFIGFFTNPNNHTIINQILHIITGSVMLIFVWRYKSLNQAARVFIGDILCIVILFGATYNVLIFGYKVKQWYYEYVWKVFVRSELYRQNYTVEHLKYCEDYDKIEKEMLSKTGKREEFLQYVELDDDSPHLPQISKKLKPTTYKNINLRPNQNQVLKKQLSLMFNAENQKSNKSLKSSDRLSKNQRNKVRDEIFGEGFLKKEENPQEGYEEMRRISEEDSVQQLQENPTEYEYDYVQQQYPQGTDMQQILKGVKKGDIVIL